MVLSHGVRVPIWVTASYLARDIDEGKEVGDGYVVIQLPDSE